MVRNESARRFALLLTVCCALGASHTAIADAPSALTPATLGRDIFFDPSLSASGQMSCATCHDPAHAHARDRGTWRTTFARRPRATDRRRCRGRALPA